MGLMHAEQGRAMADDIIGLQIEIGILGKHPAVDPLAIDVPEFLKEPLPVAYSFKHGLSLRDGAGWQSRRTRSFT